MTKIRLVPLEKLCDHSKLYYPTFITPLNFNGNWKVSQIKCVQTLTSRSNASLMYKAGSSSYGLFPLCTASLFLMGTISVLIAIIDVSHSFQNTFMLNMNGDTRRKVYKHDYASMDKAIDDCPVI